MNQLINIISTNPLLQKLFYSIISLIGTLILLRISQIIASKLKDWNPDDNGFEDMIPFLHNIGKMGIGVVLAFTLLKIWGIDVTPLLGAAGVAGIAIAFAAQDSVANLFGGVSIFFDRPFKVGDQILIQGQGNQKGAIYKIGARSTKIKTLDNVLVTIPNSVMVTNPIFNETGYDPKMRVRIELGVAYGSDLNKVENLLMQVLEKNEHVLDDPKPAVVFTDFAASSITVLVIGTVENPQKQVIAKHQLIKDIYNIFKEQNIVIPFPQQDVHLYNQN